MLYARGAERADVDRMARQQLAQVGQQGVPAQAAAEPATAAPAAAASAPAPAGLPGPANRPESAERLAERQKQSELRTGVDTAAAAKRQPAGGAVVLADDEFAEADEAKSAAAPSPADKLAPSLRDLAARIEKEGKKGNLTAGDLLVKDYKVDVMIRLSDTSVKTLEALKKLGFEQSAESKAVRLVIGSIDVRKLEELVKLEAVVAVNPVGA